MLIPFIDGVGVDACVWVWHGNWGFEDTRDMYNIALPFATPIESCIQG